MGTAVNVTTVPTHTGFTEGEIELMTGRFGSTTIVIEFDVAGLFAIQTKIDDVRTHVTISPLMGL